MTFKGLVRDPRYVQAPEGSINAELLALSQQRTYTHDMKGRVVLLPRTGIIGVPIEMTSGGHWNFVIVDGSACKKEDGMVSYPRGGYNIDVSDLELQTAVELVIGIPGDTIQDSIRRVNKDLADKGNFYGVSIGFNEWGEMIGARTFPIPATPAPHI